MKKIYLSLLLLLVSLPIIAQQYQVTGKVMSNTNETIPFVSVFIKNTSKGVSANAEGLYTITVEKGETTLIFKAIGYKIAEKTINVSGNITLNQILEEESYTLNSVVIKKSAEDPAFEIIRQAIKKRKYHLNEVKAYSSQV